MLSELLFGGAAPKGENAFFEGALATSSTVSDALAANAEALALGNSFGCASLSKLPLDEAVPNGEKAFFAGASATPLTFSVLGGVNNGPESDPGFGVEPPNGEKVFLDVDMGPLEPKDSFGDKLFSELPLGEAVPNGEKAFFAGTAPSTESVLDGVNEDPESDAAVGVQPPNGENAFFAGPLSALGVVLRKDEETLVAVVSFGCGPFSTGTPPVEEANVSSAFLPASAFILATFASAFILASTLILASTASRASSSAFSASVPNAKKAFLGGGLIALASA